MKFLINTFFIEIAKNIAELWTAYAKAFNNNLVN